MTKAVGAVPRTEVRGLGSSTYHVWFSPRRRKAALQGVIDEAVRQALTQIARQRRIVLLESETAFDHVHLLVRLPSNLPLPDAMRYLKGASARFVFQQFPELKLDLGHDHFWQRGYGFRPVAAGALEAIRSYIRNHRSDNEEEPRTLVRGVVPHNPDSIESQESSDD